MGGLRLQQPRALLILTTPCRREPQAELTIRRSSLREKRLPIAREARTALQALPTHDRRIREPQTQTQDRLTRARRTHDQPSLEPRIRDQLSPIVDKPRRPGTALAPTHHAARPLRRVRTRTGRRLVVQLIVQLIAQATTGLRRHLARQLRRDL